VYTEAPTVLKAVMTDFFFNCWCFEIPSENRILHVPGCVYNHEENVFEFVMYLLNCNKDKGKGIRPTHYLFSNPHLLL
jgi:hypothetical protein